MKEPWLAVNLSLFYSGVGQIYAGRRNRGIAFLIIHTVLFAVLVWGMIAPRGNMIAGIVAGISLIFFMIYNLGDAYRSVTAAQTQTRDSKRKDPWFAVFLTRFLPGLGHLAAGKTVMGILFLLPTLVLMALSESWMLGLVVAVLWTLSAYSAYAIIDGRSRGLPRPLGVVCILILVTHVGTDNVRALLKSYRNPTRGMSATLQPGDHILTTTRNTSSVERGDVVVFSYPPDPDRKSIKRIIGLPGETLEIRDRVVHIDGEALEESYLQSSDAPLRPPGYQNPSIFPPGAGNRDNYGPVVVPDAHVFVLGDNRANSDDSRYFGSVSVTSVLGRAYRIYWPVGRSGPVD